MLPCEIRSTIGSHYIGTMAGERDRLLDLRDDAENVANDLRRVKNLAQERGEGTSRLLGTTERLRDGLREQAEIARAIREKEEITYRGSQGGISHKAKKRDKGHKKYKTKYKDKPLSGVQELDHHAEPRTSDDDLDSWALNPKARSRAPDTEARPRTPGNDIEPRASKPKAGYRAQDTGTKAHGTDTKLQGTDTRTKLQGTNTGTKARGTDTRTKAQGTDTAPRVSDANHDDSGQFFRSTHDDDDVRPDDDVTQDLLQREEHIDVMVHDIIQREEHLDDMVHDMFERARAIQSQTDVAFPKMPTEPEYTRRKRRRTVVMGTIVAIVILITATVVIYLIVRALRS